VLKPGRRRRHIAPNQIMLCGTWKGDSYRERRERESLKERASS